MPTFREVLDNQTQILAMGDLGEAGFRAVGRHTNPQHLIEAAQLIQRVIRGDRRATFLFQEAMSTSDFPILTGQILERTVLASYAEAPASWPAWCKRGTINDLTRTVQRIALDRGGARLDGPIVPDASGASGSGPTGVKELTEYPEAKRSERSWSLRLYKYGRRMAFSWELFLADDLNQLKDTPALFGQAARNTEEHLATGFIASSTGPNATFFSVANGNLLAANAGLGTLVNAPLSITSLAAAMIQMVSQKNLDGEPIAIRGAVLMVPPSLEITARNIINATQIWMNDMGGTIDTTNKLSLQRLLTENWAKGMVRPVTNWWLPIIDTTSGTSAWYLFADPGNGRPAVELDFLRGHEQPEIFLKTSNQVPVGGGVGADPLGGDFDTDQIVYKVRHCVGGGTLDPRMALASKGTGA
jgi:hypothetical protein